MELLNAVTLTTPLRRYAQYSYCIALLASSWPYDECAPTVPSTAQ